ncbi:hypothetical protein RhiirB3_431454 [Rhizophagus irregularis]|nr:hypothetical protein RhiirB3_431454 [Rhizophagus irregularis]
MTDNTKLKSQLKYPFIFGCIIGSILSKEETFILIFRRYYKNQISNGIAKVVHIYLLWIPLPKFPPVAIAIIPNNKGSDTVDDIEKLHRKLIEEIAPQLHLHILSIAEFQAQQSDS